MKVINNRQSIRLKEYDYSQNGYYFVTICTQNGENLYGQIIDGKMDLNEYGEIIKKQWLLMPMFFNNILLHEFIIMPNHIHGIIQIVGSTSFRSNDVENIVSGSFRSNDVENVGAGSPRPQNQNEKNMVMGTVTMPLQKYTLGQMIGYYKYQTTKQINIMFDTPGNKLWQRNYYDHIIRSEKELNNIIEYIKNNPIKWDCFN